MRENLLNRSRCFGFAGEAEAEEEDGKAEEGKKEQEKEEQEKEEGEDARWSVLVVLVPVLSAGYG